MGKKLTKKEFVKKANIKHNNFYGYAKFNYINNDIKSIIICPRHGNFPQTAHSHLKGRGCKECWKENKKLTIKEFIERSNVMHDNFYTYNKTNYDGVLKEVIITCPKHGYFKQTPNSHMGGSGCFKCSIERTNIGKNESNYFRPFISDYFKDNEIIFNYEVRKEINPEQPFLVDVVVKKLNLAFEYDEKHHKYTKKYDSFRQKFIEEKTGLKIIRVDDKKFMKEGKKYFESLL